MKKNKSIPVPAPAATVRATAAPMREIAPDQQKITKIQAARLAALAQVNASELEHVTIAQVSERLKWKIDPALFFFRKICGKVVKKDPITGVEYPVPYATVYVEDTDCNFVGYFPKPWPWGWFFPFFCHREVIGKTKTDECGNFCVWIPRFDIDWILEWRKKRICFPIIFRRPSLGDLIDPPVAGPWPPIPGPDPGPLRKFASLPPSIAEAVGGNAAGKLAQQLANLRAAQSFGAPNAMADEALSARAFETEMPPPLPPEFHRTLAGQDDVIAAKGASPIEGIRAAIAMKLGLNPSAKEIAGLDPRRYIGPFLRCYDVFVPEWHLILDVPDITFRVTQDTNGDGTEENIYSESFFDVRWDAGPLPNLKLVASAIAKESHLCGTPVVPCGNVPAILFAGLMPLDNAAYFDATNGYAIRPNRPITGGGTRPAAQTPFCQTLQLYGCVNVKGAKYYRVLLSVDGGTTFSAITGLSWNIYTIPGGLPVTISADTNGWYAVLPNPTDFHPERLVLEWPTPLLGQHQLKIEIGDASKNVIGSSADVAIQTDNTVPSVVFNRLAWKFVGEGDGALRNLLGIPCPTIHRGATPKDIEVVFEVTVSANHLRDASIGTSGCGGGSFALLSGTTSHWHTSVADNSVALNGRYSLNQGAFEGAYTFGCTAISRAMNPAGADGGNLVPPDWFYDPVYIYTVPQINVAVVNEN